MKARLIRSAVTNHPMMGQREKDYIHRALDAGEEYGYGNVMAWLATAWAVKLRDEEGFKEKDAIEVVSGRGPYPLPQKGGGQ